MKENKQQKRYLQRLATQNDIMKSSIIGKPLPLYNCKKHKTFKRPLQVTLTVPAVIAVLFRHPRHLSDCSDLWSSGNHGCPRSWQSFGASHSSAKRVGGIFAWVLEEIPRYQPKSYPSYPEFSMRCSGPLFSRHKDWASRWCLNLLMGWFVDIFEAAHCIIQRSG